MPQVKDAMRSGGEDRFMRYKDLLDVLLAAYEQAAAGKGRDRHDEGEPFAEQIICTIGRKLGSFDGEAFQAVKKTFEAARGYKKGWVPEACEKELLGAINYLAAAVILLREGVGRKGGGRE